MKGFVPGMLGVSHGAIQFMTYEEMKNYYNNYRMLPIDNKLVRILYYIDFKNFIFIFHRIRQSTCFLLPYQNLLPPLPHILIKLYEQECKIIITVTVAHWTVLNKLGGMKECVDFIKG